MMIRKGILWMEPREHGEGGDALMGVHLRPRLGLAACLAHVDR